MAGLTWEKIMGLVSEDDEKEGYRYFVIYGINNNEPCMWLGKYKNKGELYKLFVENSIHLQFVDEVTRDDAIIINEQLVKNQLAVIKSPSPKILKLDS